MNEPLDELYLAWLYDQVGSVRLRRSSISYWKLFRLLYSKEFVWFVPNDDNRASDGVDLRLEFVETHHITDADPRWLDLGCSMLEMIIGLARRLSFEAEGDVRNWFWRLLENLGLESYTDKVDLREYELNEIDNVLNRVIDRTYKRDGSGGLFPLRKPKRDQRRVELWYQLSAYILELDSE